LPTQWDASKVLWKAKLKGSGQSSPAQWEDQLFLTGGSADGKERYVMCLSSKDGSTQWEDTIACAAPEAIHNMNSYATPSCATDGKIVVAYFGPGGLHAWDLAGKKLWSLDLGMGGGTWGFAASPVIIEGKVIQNCDSEGPSRLVAVDAATGKIAWETPRETKPKGGWSTPTLIEYEDAVNSFSTESSESRPTIPRPAKSFGSVKPRPDAASPCPFMPTANSMSSVANPATPTP
jgi:outer membrane protein assembly factor BamB